MIYNVFFSPTGGTEKVSHIISSEFGKEYRNVDLCREGRVEIELDENDFLIVSMPVFNGSVDVRILDFLSNIRGNDTKCVIVAVFGNRAHENALATMKEKLTPLGFRIVGGIAAVAQHSIMRKYGVGRPDQKDEAELREFVRKISESIASSPEKEVNFPFGPKLVDKTMGIMIPKGPRKCRECGECVSVCPVGAISPENLRHPDPEKCLACMRCVSYCPSGLRRVNPIILSIASSALGKALKSPKKNELFI